MENRTPVLVKDVMSTPLETISASVTLRAAAVKMREHDVNSLFVPGASAGIVTTTDVVEAVAEGRDLSAVEVADVMTANIERITTNEELSEAAAMMTNFGIKHLPVVDTDGDFVGMVSTTDLTTQLV